MTVLPLTVLAHDSPIARAYLVALQRAGYQPARVIELVHLRQAGTGAPVGRWLPATWRLAYARQAQRISNNHWPWRLRTRFPEWVDTITTGLAAIVPDAAAQVAAMYAPMDFRGFGVTGERLPLNGWRDPALGAALAGNDHPILFTGGGIVPASLLHRPAAPRMIHVHPGHLPDIRGADGLLWSQLLRQRPGYTCFWLTPGIDEGPIIAAAEFPALRFPLPAGKRLPDSTLYRALYSFCDPLLRAHQLLAAIAEFGPDARDWPATPQQIDQGQTFHFMTAAVRRVALTRLFPDTADTESTTTHGAALAADHRLTPQGVA